MQKVLGLPQGRHVEALNVTDRVYLSAERLAWKGCL